MKILLLGGAGYIGSVLAEEFLKSGYGVHVVDNFHYRQHSLGHLASNKSLDVTVGDVREVDQLKTWLRDADIVVPLAAIVGAPACAANPIDAESINVSFPLELFRQVSDSQWIIMPTTNSAYGKGEAGGFCDENSPLQPLSQYAREKVLVEQKLVELPNFTSFRLATVFGMSPRMRLDLLVNDFVNRALRDRVLVLFESSFRRNFIHVRDVAQCFLLAVQNHSKFAGEIFNVGLSEANLTKRQLADVIRGYVPSLEIVESDFGIDPDQRDYVVSNEKIEKLGFSPKYSLQEGVEELIKGIRPLAQLNFANVDR